MKAMILAAGRGERMRPLTDTTPKPLLKVANKPLIVWHIENLARNGFTEIIINIAYLGEQIIQTIGDGSKWNVNIIYSDERESGALESAGAIIKALPILGEKPFLVVNADIFCDYEFDTNFNLKDALAHLILVKNPSHNKDGDFGLKEDLVLNAANKMYTFSGIAYYNPKLFKSQKLQKSPLAPLLREFIQKKEIKGSLFNKIWHDIGTKQRLTKINEIIHSNITNTTN